MEPEQLKQFIHSILGEMSDAEEEEAEASRQRAVLLAEDLIRYLLDMSEIRKLTQTQVIYSVWVVFRSLVDAAESNATLVVAATQCAIQAQKWADKLDGGGEALTITTRKGPLAQKGNSQ